ncbi:MAG: enoyl-CoA hydratase-related protein, partial [Proteobacteria bacterium]|nr:enoyl-CoA hydratase-related protein [Pseudomonadota bacterium]
QRATERLLLSGTLASAEEALRLGLIDATVPADQLTARAEELIQQLISVPMPARQQTKKQLRASFAKDWEGFCHKEAEGAWQMLSSPAVVAALGQVLQRLSKPK